MLHYVLLVLFACLMVVLPAVVTVKLWKRSRQQGVPTAPLWCTVPYFILALWHTYRLAVGM